MWTFGKRALRAGKVTRTLTRLRSFPEKRVSRIGGQSARVLSPSSRWGMLRRVALANRNSLISYSARDCVKGYEYAFLMLPMHCRSSRVRDNPEAKRPQTHQLHKVIAGRYTYCCRSESLTGDISLLRTKLRFGRQEKTARGSQHLVKSWTGWRQISGPSSSCGCQFLTKSFTRTWYWQYRPGS